MTNPAAVVLAALNAADVPSRVTEAVPWVLARFPDLDWDWLVAQAKLTNVQNRLGYLASLAARLVATKHDPTVLSALDQARRHLEDARLAKEDTLGREVTDVERDFLRQHRPDEARHWNLLTTLRAEDLRYGA